MEPILNDDLLLINRLSLRTYSGNSLLSNASRLEREHLLRVRNKLRTFSIYFSRKYNEAYGPFETSVASGNPIVIGGKRLNVVWAGIFKGAPNKQYAVQISFVMNPHDLCLDIGFYFGRASGHTFKGDQKKELENNLHNLGIALSHAISKDSILHERYSSLFDFGFRSYSNDAPSLPEEWPTLIEKNPRNSQIVAKVKPNDFGIIENSTIDSYVSQVIFLMSAISDSAATAKTIVIKPLSPEQRAKEAERLAQIGLKGELYIMTVEQNKLRSLNINRLGYPRHIALESTHYGYDILSLDEKENEIYIEVKTTTRVMQDVNSQSFFISVNEYNTFLENREKYRLFRVYDIENNPTMEMIDLEKVKLLPDGFVVKYGNCS